MFLSMKIVQFAVYFFTLGFFASLLSGHCQVPCGIYDDASRVQQMLEDVSTIHKSIDEIYKLNDEKDVQSAQQLIRWVNNKEIHADKIINTNREYFLTLKIKQSYKDNLILLIEHHEVIIF